jgi:hypothetical protein
MDYSTEMHSGGLQTLQPSLLTSLYHVASFNHQREVKRKRRIKGVTKGLKVEEKNKEKKEN